MRDSVFNTSIERGTAVSLVRLLSSVENVGASSVFEASGRKAAGASQVGTSWETVLEIYRGTHPMGKRGIPLAIAKVVVDAM